jgi:hypothetical protein
MCIYEVTCRLLVGDWAVCCSNFSCIFEQHSSNNRGCHCRIQQPDTLPATVCIFMLSRHQRLCCFPT